MQAKYITPTDILVNMQEGETLHGNIGPMDLIFNVANLEVLAALEALNIEPDAYVAPPPEIPDITRRQIRLWLLSKGVTSADVVTEINTLPEPQRSVALIEWDGNTFKRANPFVDLIGQSLGFTSAEMDEGFVEAATL